MDLKGKIVLVTGANGGIGGALVKGLMNRGAAKVYAAARNRDTTANLVQQYAAKVVAVQLDITDRASVAAIAKLCQDADVLINNAGVNRCVSLLSPTAMECARQEMTVNFFGTLAMCRAFAPILVARGGGAIVNVCSILSLVNLPVNGTYCASKAAGHSLVQGLRAELSPSGVTVIGAYPGPVDTRMTEGQEMPKASPEQVAEAILAGVQNDDEEIFPDPMSQQVHAELMQAPKQVERQFAAMI